MVGSALMRILRARGYENIISCTHSELELTQQDEVDRFFKRERPEYVFLAAAKVGGIMANNTYKAEFIYDNIMIAANVINSAYKSGVKKLLNLGSSCIYPKYAEQPMKEDYLLTGALEPTNEPYAIAKIAALKLCRYYNEQFKTRFISVMPTNLYGPNDNYNLETSHVLPALMRKFHLAKLLRQNDYNQIRRDIAKAPLGRKVNNEAVAGSDASIKSILREFGITEDQVKIWGDGEPYREFLHADDLADACIFLITNYGPDDLGEFVNIGTGIDIKINDLASIIKDIVGYEGTLENDVSKPEGTPRKLLDVSRARALGWEAKISLEEGLRKTYDSYCAFMQHKK